MNKKGLSLLLAVSMLFTMNSVAFAEEAVVEETAVTEEAAAEDVTVEEVTAESDETVDEQYDSSDADDWKNYDIDYTKLTWTQSINGSSKTYFDVGTTTPPYTGKKLSAEYLAIYLYNEEAGYKVPVKKIKTKAKANATGYVTYTIAGLWDWKEIQGYVNGSFTHNIPETTAKALYKQAKSDLKSAKNTELTAYICPRWISGSVSNALIKTLKKNKSLSTNDLSYTYEGRPAKVGSSVIVNAKNGKVKNVKLVNVSYKYNVYDPTFVGSKRRNNSSYKIKISTTTLKKGVDYTVSGDVINFNGSATCSGYGSFKAMD
ncbi:hypothetical protein QYZ88_017650 [Lachnospiraceae bacterium C1.1]|nr:hypothetical protein [Lachnospiraceae bacterium C1.1]